MKSFSRGAQKSARFSARSHYAEKSGTDYQRIWRRFNKSGSSARVFYLDDSVGAGKQ
jgi:capsule polysaccharide modification protein KpsS